VPKLPEKAPGLVGNGAGQGRTQPMMSLARTAEEKEREAEYRAEQAALAAPTTIGSGGAAFKPSGVSGVLGAVANPIEGLLGQARSLLGGVGQAGSGGAVGVAAGAGQSDPNMQNRKDSFIASARNTQSRNDLDSQRTPQAGKFVIRDGWDIPSTLEQSVNSDLPGEIRALVRENVFDTATGRYLLIPQGSRVIGRYDAHVAYGQSRVQVIWDRLIFPDGSSIDLNGMIGQDAGGASGFHDKVDHHYVRIFGMALMTSGFSAGIEMTQGNSTSASNPYGVPSNSQLAIQALGQQMGQLGMEITRKNMDVQPTIKIPIGYRFNVRVNRDITFGEPYTAMR
jgi:type IV secretion system protein VirB10